MIETLPQGRTSLGQNYIRSDQTLPNTRVLLQAGSPAPESILRRIGIKATAFPGQYRSFLRAFSLVFSLRCEEGFCYLLSVQSLPMTGPTFQTFGLWSAMSLLLFAAAVSATGQAQPEADNGQPLASQPSEWIRTISVPLEQGEFSLGSVLGELFDQVGLDGQVARENIHLDFDVAGTAVPLQLLAIQNVTGSIVWFETHPEQLTIYLDRVRLRQEEKQLRSRFREIFSNFAPNYAAKAAMRYGMVVYQDKDKTVKPEQVTFSSHVVVLVHGLDEPGCLWLDVIPHLLAANVTVVEFLYPNDQSIEASADSFAEHLAELHALGVDRLTLVSHSMGGLVCRWVLTDPDVYNGRGSDHAALPDVSRLIMIATPNHGSHMAQLRLFSEARDQITRALSGEGLLFGAIFDGAGEAKVDLLPDSRFLNQLNARPHPEGVAMTIIAGKASPISRNKLDYLADMLRPHLSDAVDEKVDTVIDTVARLQDGIGDGAVSLESAYLAGVEDFVVVPANHVTIIRQIVPYSEKIPLAIPVLMARLDDDRENRKAQR